MSKKIVNIIGLFALLAFGLLIGGTLAYWRVEGNTEAVLATGQLKGTLINEYEAQSSLYPGDSLNQVISVKNSGSLDMVVRLKVETSWEEESLAADKLQIDYNSQYWLEDEDGFFYYKGILKPGEACEEALCESISLSKDASIEYVNQKGNIRVRLECIQASANAVSMWDKTYAELGVEEPPVRESVSGTVEITEDKTIQFGPSDKQVMSAFLNMAPGETCTQVLTIKNNYKEDVSFYLSAVSDDKDAKKILDMLSKYGTLKITDTKGKVLYEGTVTDKEEEEIVLAKVEKGKSQDVIVMFSLSPKTGNEYQNLVGKTQWKFIAQGDKNIENNPSAKDPIASGTTGLPKTGDSYMLLAGVGILLVLTLLAMLYVVWQEKKGKHTV